MTSGHTLITIFAFALLATILTNFFDITASVGNSISSGQDGIFLTTLTTSYIEIAQGLAFDAITDTMHARLPNATTLTAPTALGPEAGEDSLYKFNDFDDFNSFEIEKEVPIGNRRYRTEFNVVYVEPENVEHIVTYRTFVKRMDLKTWRTHPVADSTGVDTLRVSFVMGYFHFD
jgi:hypothetical protein